LNFIVNPFFPFRLNKIGKNPNIMAQKDEADGHETNTISAVVNALAAEAENHNNR
jgi:hyperpolarization activated cyclic nucleotide-gated potassium channel 2